MSTNLLIHYASNNFVKQSSKYSLQKYVNTADKWVMLSRYKQRRHEENLMSLFTNISVLDITCDKFSITYLEYMQNIINKLDLIDDLDTMYIAYNFAYIDLRVEERAYKEYLLFKNRCNDANLANATIAAVMPHYRATLMSSSSSVLHYFVTCDIIDYCVKRNVKIKHIIEDPLCFYFKFNSFADKIEHTYFHKFANDSSQFCHEFMGKTYCVNIKYDDYIEVAYLLNSEHINKYSNVSKTLNFSVGLTDWRIESNERTQHILDLLHLKNKEHIELNMFSKFLDNTKHVEYSKLINKWYVYDEYLQLLASSKCTIVFASYATNCFSKRRFIEALSVKCIPLVHYKSNYEIALHKDLLAIYKKHNLVVTDLTAIEDNIKYICDNYDSIITEIYETDYIKQLVL
jgi:hypothetical protein